MTADSNKLPSETYLRWNRTDPAASAEVEEFWKKLRHYYRTGQKPKTPEFKASSALFDLLKSEDSVYPFVLDDKNNTSIPLDNNTLHQFLKHVLHEHQRENRQAFKTKLKSLIEALGDQLNIDNSSKKSSHLSETFDFADELIAFDRMVDIIPKKGAQLLNKAQLTQLNEVIIDLQVGLKDYEDKEAIIVVPISMNANLSEDLSFEHTNVFESKEDAFKYTGSIFSNHIQSYTALIKAHRIAQLHTEGSYKEEIHDQYFESFSWHRFTSEELSLLQPIILLVTHQYLINHLSSFSLLVSSNQPVNIIVINEEYVTIPNPDVSWEDASHQFRQEIASLAISHRNVYTFQNCLDNPKVVFDGLAECLKSTQPGVCHIAIPATAKKSSDDLALICRAQNVGRFFPGIIYRPENNNKWEGRFDHSNNIQPEKNWPQFILKAITPDKTEAMIDVAFTYADYKAIYPQKAEELMIIPPKYYTESLIPLNDYLELEEIQLYGKIPYIWLQDENFELHRAAVPNVWVVSCEERLDYWQFLKAIGNYKAPSTENKPVQNEELPPEGNEDTPKIEASNDAAVLDKAIKKVLAVLLEE